MSLETHDSAFAHGHIALAVHRIDGTKNKMVEKRDAHDLRRLKERLCHLDVRPARLRIARGMVVRHHDGVCAPAHRLLEDFPWMHHRPVHRATKDDERVGERMHLRIEDQYAEILLPVFWTENTPENAVTVLDFRDIQLAFVVIATGILAPHQLERRRKLHSLGLANSEDLRLWMLLVVHLNLTLERRKFGADEVPRSSKRGDEPVRQREHIASGRTGLE